MDRRLGRPLPHQPANPAWAHLSPRGLSVPRFHPQVLCGISVSFPTLSPSKRQIPMRYSPVRHSTPGASSIVSVRLACVKHAASVQSEPESNSSVHFPTQTVILNFKIYVWMFCLFSPSENLKPSIQSQIPTAYGNKTPAQTIFSLVIDPDVSGFSQSPAPWQGAHYSFNNPPRNNFFLNLPTFFINTCFCRKCFCIRFSAWPG